MPRLKSLTAHPPYGFCFIEPAIGMATPITGSFNSVVEQVMALRQANPYLAQKHGWGVDQASVEYDVEQQNVARCLAGGWTDFVQFDASPNPPPLPVEYEGAKKKSRAVAGIKRISAGVGVLLEWLGAGAKPVEERISEARAAICATCPRNNKKTGILDYFTSNIADKIKTQLEIKNDLALKTSSDNELGICEACDCTLTLKVHTPLNHILPHTSAEVKARLDPRCWILHEKEQQ